MLNDRLPFSQACENNKEPILKVLKEYISDQESLLEIAGGTGQHGEFFAKSFPNLLWQTSDLPSAVAGLNLRISETSLQNFPPALTLDVNDSNWNVKKYELLFTANSLHIMSEKSVENFFSKIPNILQQNALVFIYGPFKYGGKFTTKSNAEFNEWLKEKDLRSGVRDFEVISELAVSVGLSLVADVQMPSNNQLLVFSRS